MAREKISIWKYICERCGHEWIPRDLENDPRVCPKCKTPYWDKPRRDVLKKKLAALLGIKPEELP